MSHLGEFELIGRIAAACHPSEPACHPDRSEGSLGEGPGVTGIGDDCAVIPQRDGVDTLVTTDLLIEGRHFLLEDVTPYELGWKSAAVNISDIAAMGGRPVASFLSIALPKDLAVPSLNKVENVDGGQEIDGTAEWVDRFIAGFNDLSSRFGVALLGGDTSASPDKLFINVTVLGECPHGQAVKRSGARPGDLVCVTGPLGDSAAGLKLILERAGGEKLPSQGLAPADLRCAHPSQPDGWAPPVHVATGGYGSPEQAPETADLRCAHPSQPDGYLIRRHYLPVPRVAEGQALGAIPGVHSMMDISDGIASDLRHILDASSRHARPDRASLSAEIDLQAIPLSEELRSICAERGWDPFELAVGGGEDYELLFTLAPESLASAKAALDGGLTVIGRIIDSRSEPGMTNEEPGMTGGKSAVNEPCIRWLGSDKDYKGFTHF